MCGNNSSLYYSGYTASLTEIDADFNNRYKSKMLFLDYDIASKLNFFTDAGEYRLPNSIRINNSANSASLSTFTNNTSINLMSYTTMTSDFYISSGDIPAYISIRINLNSTQLNNLVIILKHRMVK